MSLIEYYNLPFYQYGKGFQYSGYTEEYLQVGEVCGEVDDFTLFLARSNNSDIIKSFTIITI